ncbi:MAG TPA: electron transport complex subunit E [Clostridiaceae bacterium]|nr:electron transport complex subunit E [Clostridiaceae bacterium]
MEKKKKSLGSIFLDGIINQNPAFRLLLGNCPSLAITTLAKNGVGMGLAATFVLVGSNLFISLLRKIIPEKVRIPCFIVVIASFTTIVEMIMAAFLPELDKELGIYIPLIVVNCIIFARAEMFAQKNPPVESFMDGIGMGTGFMIAITIIGSVRELLGSGTWMGIPVTVNLFEPATFFILPPGGFLVMGLLIALFNKVFKVKDPRTIEDKEVGCCAVGCQGCANAANGGETV